MKRKTLMAFLLMVTLLAGSACAQMNFELQNGAMCWMRRSILTPHLSESSAARMARPRSL